MKNILILIGIGGPYLGSNEIQGKVCKVVVDSRSISNFILEEVVTKLKLKKIPHNNLYKVTWLKG